MKPTGDELLAVCEALANPHRLRIVTALSRGRRYVSELAREVGLSRPLLYMHLKRLRDAGLVSSQLELSEDGKAMNYFELRDFAIHLTPALIAQAAETLTGEDRTGRGQDREGQS